MKILVLTQYYPPEGAAIPAEIAQGLSERGHEVRVLTGFPNYPEGKIFPGYRQRWRSREQHGDVQVLRVPLLADHSDNPARRILNYVSFALTAASARGYARGVDVIYVYATQMTPALGPWLWRKFRGAPYVLHVQDLWPDSILESSMIAQSPAGPVIRTVLNPWLRRVYDRAAAVIGIAPTMVRTLIGRGSPAARTSLIYNWADDSAAPAEKEKDPATTSILFAGNIGDMQDLETVVRAAHLVEDTSVHVTLVGDGIAREKVKALAEELGCTNVTFRGSVPREEMPAIYEAADFSLVTLRDLEVFRGTIPSKFQGSIAHGVPVITTVQGDLRMLVDDLGVGFTADGEDPEALARVFRAADSMDPAEYRDLRRRTREVYLERFSRRSGVDAVEAVLAAAAAGTVYNPTDSIDKDK
ncbi:glycosyltransferase family 4 protein [Corynebacterium nasicanis]|uniref:Glycosyltransferase family 4 protein n=1 Tax=Corynebacterium nasicanis TaxID=1448267 RepID=A0ABW1QAM8_9CORY